MTSKDKLDSCNSITLTMKSLQTSDPVLISNANNLEDYSNSFSKEISKKLWYPLETDFQDLDSNYLNGYFGNSAQNSQRLRQRKMKNHLQKTSSASLQLSPQAIMEEDHMSYPRSQEKIHVEKRGKTRDKTRKIRIYPSKTMESMFKEYCNTSRHYYNETVQNLKNQYNSTKDTDDKINLNRYFLRKEILISDKNLKENESWKKNTPYDTREMAINMCAANHKSCITQLQNGNIKFFNVSFKSKREKTQGFAFNKKALDITKDSIIRMFSSRVKQINKSKGCNAKIRTARRMKKWISEYYEDMEDSEKCNSNIIYQKVGKKRRWYLCLTTHDEYFERTFEKENIVSLDPGIKTFQTFYSPNGTIGKLGQGLGDMLESKYERIDELKSLSSKEENKRTRINLKHKASRLRTKIVNTVNDFQWKSASFLCRKYKYILFPDFKSKPIKEGIHKSQRRKMDTLSHYKFRMKMEHMCKEYGSKMIVVSEAYTSKTCGNCGSHRNKTKNKKDYDLYTCKKCDFVMDRDYNGARNILIRYLTENNRYVSCE